MQYPSPRNIYRTLSTARCQRSLTDRLMRNCLVFGVGLLFFILFSITLNASDASASPLPQHVTLQLKWTHQFQFAGYYAALQQGFYKDAGLDVTIKEGGAGIDSVDEVLQGRADFAVAGPELLLRFLDGAPVIALAVIFQHSPSVLLSLVDEHIFTPHDLEGKKIMLSRSGEPDIWAMLSNEKIGISDFHLISPTWNADELIDKKVDVMAAYLTNTPFLLENRGIPYSVIKPSSYGIDFYGDCLFTTQKKTLDNTDITQRFINASLKGWEYAFAHQEELIDSLLTTYHTSQSRAHLEYEAKIIRELTMPNLIQIGHMNMERWKHMANTYVSLGMAIPGQNISAFVYTPDAREKQQLGLALGIFRIALAGVGIIIIWLYLFNSRLKTAVKRRTEELDRVNQDMTNEIAERKRTGLQLLESEERLRTLIDTIPDFVCLKDEEGRWLLANEAALRLFDVPADMYRGKNDIELAELSPEMAPAFQESRKDDELAWSWQRLIRAEVVLPIGTEKQAVFDVIRVPVSYSEGVKKGLIVIGRDITERKRFEEALRESNKVTSVLYKIANIVGAGTDHDVTALMTKVHAILHEAIPAQNIALALINKDTDRLEFDYFSDEHDAQPAPVEHISNRLNMEQEYFNEPYDVLVTVLRSAEPILFTKAVMHLTGMNPPGSMPESWLGVPLKVGDRTIGLIWLKDYENYKAFSHKDVGFMNAVADQIAMGISRHQTTQDLRQAKEAAILANRAKSNFLASMSHEIRTPLNAIVGLADLLATSDLNVSQKDYIETIRGSAGHLLGIISDILDFSKIEARKMELEHIVFDLSELVESLKKTMSVEADKKNLAFHVAIQPETPTILCGDPGRLRQVLVNLMGNAIKFTEHGQVEVFVGQDQCDEYATTHSIHFQVADTGVGIPESICNSVFESFQQADDSTTRKYGGTGLGLAISKQLVELMNGQIWVESTVDEGSIFHVIIPFEAGDPDKLIAQEKSIPDGNTSDQPHLNLLLVEDNPVNVKVALAHLAIPGHDVAVATNGREALKILSEHTFDAVLMDIEMPEMDGLTATQYIRKGGNEEYRVRDPKIPIIAMTAHVTTDIKEHCRQVGMNGHMGKPVNFLQMTQMLIKLLSQENSEFIENTPPAQKAHEVEILDKATAAARLGIEATEFERIFQASLKEIQSRMDAIEAGLATGNNENVAINSHALKSTCAVIGAETCRNLSHTLEKAAKNNDKTSLPIVFNKLSKAIAVLFKSIEK